MKILVLNAGSSTLKCHLHELGTPLPATPPDPLWEATAEWSADNDTVELSIRNAHGAMLREERLAGRRSDLLAFLLGTLWSGSTQVIAGPGEVDVIGHRVVHGGREYRESVRITPRVKAAIARLAEFAPEHNPLALEGVAVARRLFGPRVAQVATFDTAFHAALPPAASVYPVPYAWYVQGIQRYGFHGLSHQYCAERAAQILGRDPRTLRLITCHLGNGCSLAAVDGGQSRDTTMGFTPLDGLMMGSRPGALDPGILIYLLRQPGATVAQLDDVLQHHSGLLGVSGVSSDLRAVVAAIQRGDAQAALALDVYVHHLQAGIGAMLAALGSVDALVFAGGVGEHSSAVRERACEPFNFLGLRLDVEKNSASPPDTDIATTDAAVRVVIVQTREDWIVARDCWRLVSDVGKKGRGRRRPSTSPGP